MSLTRRVLEGHTEPWAAAPELSEMMAPCDLACCVEQIGQLADYAGRVLTRLSDNIQKCMTEATALDSRVTLLCDELNRASDAALQHACTSCDLQSDADNHVRVDNITTAAKIFGFLTPETRDSSLQELISQCVAPPRLDLLDIYREDGLKSITFYSFPDFFAQEWSNVMQRDSEAKRKKKRQKKGGFAGENVDSHSGKSVNRRLTSLQVQKPRQSAKRSRLANEIQTTNFEADAPCLNKMEPNPLPPPPHGDYDSASLSLPPPEPTTKQEDAIENEDAVLIPPPPPPLLDDTFVDHEKFSTPPPPPPPEWDNDIQQSNGGLPSPPASVLTIPPPPPLPPQQQQSKRSLEKAKSVSVVLPAPRETPRPHAGALTEQSRKLKPVNQTPSKEGAPRDTLLSSIRGGTFMLKPIPKDEVGKNQRTTTPQASDVASILMRRAAFEMTDSEEDDDDSQGSSDW